MVRRNKQVGVRDFKRLLRKYQKTRPRNSLINCVVFRACVKDGTIISGWKMIGMEAVAHCWIELQDRIIDPTSEETTYFKNFHEARRYIRNDRDSLKKYVYHKKRINNFLNGHEMPVCRYSDGLVKVVEYKIHTKIRKANTGFYSVKIAT